jgi:hypothetical protein
MPDQPSTEKPGTPRRTPRRADGRKGWWLTGIVLLVAAIAAVWAFAQQRSAARALARTESALQLQVLASRLGMAAFEAEYGDYDAARTFASEAFDGIANYGIEEGRLRQDYADVLGSRDDVIAMLATRRPEASERLMTLFFSLQIPVDTELDPTHILPAADSGLGLAPPRRTVPPAGTADSAARAGTRDSAARASTRDSAARRDTRDSAARRDTLRRAPPGGR